MEKQRPAGQSRDTLMSVKYLYYTEDPAMGGVLGAGNAVPMLEQFLAMYGGERMCIHPMDASWPPTASERYFSLEAARANHPNHHWFYLDAHSPLFLDDIDLPSDNVVFAAGHDGTGFNGSVIEGPRCQIRTLMPYIEGRAMIMLAAACAHYWERLRCRPGASN